MRRRWSKVEGLRRRFKVESGSQQKEMFKTFIEMSQTGKLKHKSDNWYAVYTRPRWEKKVAEHLQAKGIEHYCPLNKVTRQWSDRKKVVLDPVFKGYVFVKPGNLKLWEIKKVPGILNFVYWLGEPAPIREDEINNIRKFLNEFTDVQVEKKGFTVNNTVRITRGVLMNYEGIIVEVFGNRAVVKIDTLDIQLSAHFDKKNLELIRNSNS